MTSRPLVASIALALSLLAAGCPGPQAPAQASTVKKEPIRTQPKQTGPSGADLYKSSCAACHGPDARGIPNLGKDLVDSEFCKSQTDDQMIEFLKKGRAADDPANTTKVAMPPKGGNPALKDDDLRAIVTYLRTLRS